jgi:hypothetical protein
LGGWRHPNAFFKPALHFSSKNVKLALFFWWLAPPVWFPSFTFFREKCETGFIYHFGGSGYQNDHIQNLFGGTSHQKSFFMYIASNS